MTNDPSALAELLAFLQTKKIRSESLHALRYALESAAAGRGGQITFWLPHGRRDLLEIRFSTELPALA